MTQSLTIVRASKVTAIHYHGATCIEWYVPYPQDDTYVVVCEDGSQFLAKKSWLIAWDVTPGKWAVTWGERMVTVRTEESFARDFKRDPKGVLEGTSFYVTPWRPLFLKGEIVNGVLSRRAA